LSVRQTEELVRKLYTSEKNAVNNSVKSSISPALKKIEDNLASHYSTKVKLSHTKKGSGSITFEYYSLEELNSILDKMNILVN
ncbi:MAG: chromosome partitioning protein ParB, partial [Ginsengibacter sp.]